MLGYSYDENTKEYISSYTLAIDPLESKIQGKTVYARLAKNSTYKEPLPKVSDKAVIFDNNDWKYINDFRGKRAYNDEGLLTINYLGDLQGSDKLLTQEQIEGIDNGILIWKDGQIIPKPAPTTEEILLQKESEYNMSRWQHEYIVANPESFPQFVLNRAQELEDLAEELRRENENNQQNNGDSN